MNTALPPIPQSISAPSLSRPGSVTRRSHRQPKATDGTDTLSQAVSTSSASSTRAKSQSMTDTAPQTKAGEAPAVQAAEQTDPANPEPWKHPDELPYIRREDWSQDLMLEYLCQKSFSIPPRDSNPNNFMEIIPKDGQPISIPRKYRVPLMFLAKFQWESLRLVLNAPEPAKEWQEFKFDIIHITRLCQHLFHQAREAKEKSGPKGLDKMWRSPMFDRVLTRFYHHWFISREWSLKHFYQEFQEEEYQVDILRNDWARWSFKGHKGFRLTKEEIQNGIPAEDFMRGLGRNADGHWSWAGEPVAVSGPVPESIPTEPISPPPPEDLEAITNDTPANNTIEIKREHLESAGETLKDQVEHKSTPNPSPPSTLPVNETAAADSSTPSQLAGTKRPRDDADSSTTPSPRKRIPTARRSMAEAYRYGQPSNPKPQSPEKSSETPSATGTSSGEHGEGKDSPTKLSFKFRRIPPHVSPPPILPPEPIKLKRIPPAVSPPPVSPPKNIKLKRIPPAVSPPLIYEGVQSKRKPPAVSPPPIVPSKSVQAKRIPPAVSPPPVSPPKKKARVDGSSTNLPSSSNTSLTSATAPVARYPRKRAPRTSRKEAVATEKQSTPPNPPEAVSKVPATALPESFKPSPLPPGLLSLSNALMNNGGPFSKSPAAILVPSNPKQNMSYVPPGPDSPSNANMDVTTDSASPPVTSQAAATPPPAQVTPTETHKDTKANSSVETRSPNETVLPVANSTGPKPPALHPESSPQPSLPQTSNQGDNADRPKLYPNAFESIFAHGLLEVGHLPPVTRDRIEPDTHTNKDVAASTDGTLPSPSQSIVEKPLANGASPPTQGVASNGHISNKVAPPVSDSDKQTTQLKSAPDASTSDAQHTASPRNTPRSALASETVTNTEAMFPLSESISALIPRASSESRDNRNSSKSASSKGDKMVVDNDVNHATDELSSRLRARSITSEPVGLLMAQDTRAKSLHTILLLRDLLEFLRSSTPSPPPAHATSEADIHAIMNSRTRRQILDEEENLTVDQRLDVLAHASVALAKVLYPFRGGELERRIVSLDKRLQQQFDLVWSEEEQLSAALQLKARLSPDKGTQTATLSVSRGVQALAEPIIPQEPPKATVELISQGVQAWEEPASKESSAIAVQTDDAPEPLPQPAERRSSPLSSDTTMIDVAPQQPMDTGTSEIPKPSTSDMSLSPASLLSDASRSSEPVAKIMMAIMRNMADLLECSTRDDGFTRSAKGKEREVESDESRLRPSDGYADSPIVSTIINEFRGMKEELRHTEQWSREELRAMNLHHRTEVESLKGEIQKGKDEMAAMKNRHQAEIDRLKASLSETKGKKKEESMDYDTRTSASEFQELRRRISSLESRSRFDGLGVDATGATSHGSPIPATPSELLAIRPAPWQSHPLGHLMAQDYHGAPSPSPQPHPSRSFARETSSKPGTPLSADRPLFYARSTDGMEMEETLPVPVKSQRKSFMFPRAPVG